MTVSSGAFELDTLITAPTFCLLRPRLLRHGARRPAGADAHRIRLGAGWPECSGAWCVYVAPGALGGVGALGPVYSVVGGMASCRGLLARGGKRSDGLPTARFG